jgi:uncharacterized membrane protein
MMIFWLVIIGALFYMLIGGNINLGNITKNADNVLDERLAKGEISVEEYEQIKRTLKENK